MRARLIIILACLLGLPWLSEAATRYVSPGGSGSTCSNASPCSLNTGLGQTGPGDTLYLKGGTYEAALRSGTPSGTPGNPVTIASAPGESATLRPTSGFQIIWLVGSEYHDIIFRNLILDSEGLPITGGGEFGFDREGGVFLYNGAARITIEGGQILNGLSTGGITLALTTDVTIRGVEIHHNGDSPQFDHGIYSSCGHTNTIIENNVFHHNGNYPIHQWSTPCGGAGGDAQGLIVRNNTLYANTGNHGGILIDRAPGALVYNNIIRGSQYGISIADNDIKAYSNTLYQTVRGFEVQSSSGIEIRNNIIDDSSTPFVNPGNATTSNNLCDSAGGGCTLSGNPGFVSASNGDFHIASSNSPAVNAGVTLGAPYNVDAEGRTRPSGQYTIGAYQFGEEVPPPNPDPDGLYVELKGNGSFNDTSGQGNHGTAQGGMLANGTPIISGSTSFVFDGVNDYIALPQDTAFRPTSEFCVSVWLNTTHNDYWYAWDIAASGGGFGLWGDPTGGIHGYAQTAGGFKSVAFSSPSVRDGTNRHLVYTKDSLGMRLYEAAIQRAFTSTTDDLVFVGTPTPVIGRNALAAQEFFSGRFAHIRFYNFACTPQDVANLYAEFVPTIGLEMSSMAFYKSNLGEGNQLGAVGASRQHTLNETLGIGWAIRKNDSPEETHYFRPYCRRHNQTSWGSWTEVVNSPNADGIAFTSDLAVDVGYPTTTDQLPLGNYTFVTGVYLAGTVDVSSPYDIGQRVTLDQGEQTRIEMRVSFGSPLVAGDMVQCRPHDESGNALDFYGDNDSRIATLTMRDPAPPVSPGLGLAGGATLSGTKVSQ